MGVSACLLGQPVRYDGRHKKNLYITQTLGALFDFVAVCPEVEAGFTVPREAMQLEGESKAPRLMTIESRFDCTEKMQKFCRKKTKALEQENLAGFIFKSKSPSCGLRAVDIFNAQGLAHSKGQGLFARAFQENFLLLPVTDELALEDEASRHLFIKAVTRL